MTGLLIFEIETVCRHRIQMGKITEKELTDWLVYCPIDGMVSIEKITKVPMENNK